LTARKADKHKIAAMPPHTGTRAFANPDGIPNFPGKSIFFRHIVLPVLLLLLLLLMFNTTAAACAVVQHNAQTLRTPKHEGLYRYMDPELWPTQPAITQAVSRRHGG
jgi:hypothetical protein